jgi:hypothetical protein
MIARLALAGVAIAAATAAAEVGLRACDCARLGLAIPGTSGSLPFPDNPAGRFHFHYNSYGDRTAEPLRAGDTRERWCVAGDSHANGIGVDDADRLSDKLDASLNASGRRVAVFNVAAPGATLPHYVEMIRRCASLYSAHSMVVVVYLGNDLIELSHWIDRGRPDVEREMPTPAIERARAVLRYSYLFDTAALAWHSVSHRRSISEQHNRELQAYRQAEFYTAHTERRASDLNAFAAELDELKSQASRSSARLLIVALPSWLRLDAGASMSPIEQVETDLEREMIDRARRSGVRVLDATAALGRQPAQSEFWTVDRHLSVVGHGIVARAIFDDLTVVQ